VAAAGAAAAVLAGAGAASAVTLTGTSEAAHAATTAAHVGQAPAHTARPAAHAATTAAPKPAAQTVKPTTKAGKPTAKAGKPTAKAATTGARPAAPAGPYRIYDSVTPSSIPAHAPVATYADGGYAVSPSQVAGRGHVLWIDTNGSDPRASALDVEPGDATPSMAASWAWHKLHAAANSVAIIYTMRSEWPAAQAAVHTLPPQMQSHVRWWIADPTGVPHIVPGASATQWYWGPNYDITTASPGF